MPSFDIISEVNLQEVDNAINHTRKELATRYDFKGTKASIEWDKKEITVLADDETRLESLSEMLSSKMHKRGVDILALKFEKTEPAGGMMLRQKVKLVMGIEREIAKKIVKTIKDSKLKVEAQIHEEKVRVSSKSIDTLQETISLLKRENFGVPLQFSNMRS